MWRVVNEMTTRNLGAEDEEHGREHGEDTEAEEKRGPIPASRCKPRHGRKEDERNDARGIRIPRASAGWLNDDGAEFEKPYDGERTENDACAEGNVCTFGCHGTRATPNDPKLSDGGGWRGSCRGGGKAVAE